MQLETMHACADLILTDAIEDMARETGQTKAEIRKAMMTSAAYDCLYDPDYGLWAEGPAYFIDFYRRLEGKK